MFDPSTIFQRSHAGREEIHQKSHGLTQSERLVLIMIDGVSTYRELRSKLPVLTDERFERALQNLHKKELAHEVLMPLEGQTPEELERTVIDRFLQQDPLDPVTIMLRDPEDELGQLGQAPMPATPTHHEVAVEPCMSAASPALAARLESPLPEAPPIPELPVYEPAMDAHHNQLADSLAQEVRARQPERLAKRERAIPIESAAGNPEMKLADDSMLSPIKSVHWGYWLIAVGIGFLAGYILAKLGS